MLCIAVVTLSISLLCIQICLPSLADTIRLLSHFTGATVRTYSCSCVVNFVETCGKKVLWCRNKSQILANPFPLSLIESMSPSPDSRINEFHKVFSCPDWSEAAAVVARDSPSIPLHVRLTLFTYRILYDLALDNFDRHSNSSGNSTSQSSSSSSARPGGGQQQHQSVSPACSKRLNLSNLSAPDPVIVHSGVVIIMIRLLPSIKSTNETLVDSCLCQLYCAELVKSLFSRNEKNQQIMAGVGVCTEIIEKLGEAICDEKAVIHSAIQYVFERVGTQALSAGELRSGYVASHDTRMYTNVVTW